MPSNGVKVSYWWHLGLWLSNSASPFLKSNTLVLFPHLKNEEFDTKILKFLNSYGVKSS
jgi:hypothetical protein